MRHAAGTAAARALWLGAGGLPTECVRHVGKIRELRSEAPQAEWLIVRELGLRPCDGADGDARQTVAERDEL